MAAVGPSVGSSLFGAPNADVASQQYGAQKAPDNGFVAAACFVLDLSGNVRQWSEKSVALTGRCCQQVLGRPLQQAFGLAASLQEQKTLDKIRRQALEGVETEAIELPMLTEDGRWRKILLSAQCGLGPRGEVVRINGTFMDMTSLGSKFEESSLVRDLPALVFSTNKLGVIMEWNRMAEEVMGFSTDDVVGRHISEVFSTFMEETEADEAVEPILSGDKSSSTVCFHIVTQGRSHWVSIDMATRCEEGEVAGLFGVGKRPTKVETESPEARRRSQELENLVNEMPLTVVAVDVHGCIVEWNRGAEAISVCPASKAVGRRFVQEFVVAADRPVMAMGLMTSLSGQWQMETPSLECNLCGPSDSGSAPEEATRLSMQVVCRRDPQGSITGAICVGWPRTGHGADGLSNMCKQSSKYKEPRSWLDSTSTEGSGTSDGTSEGSEDGEYSAMRSYMSRRPRSSSKDIEGASTHWQRGMSA